MRSQVVRGAWSHVPVAGCEIPATIHELAGGTAKLPDEIDGGSLKTVLLSGGKGTVERSPPD